MAVDAHLLNHVYTKSRKLLITVTLNHSETYTLGPCMCRFIKQQCIKIDVQHGNIFLEKFILN